jgi:hypothetical protein
MKYIVEVHGWSGPARNDGRYEPILLWPTWAIIVRGEENETISADWFDVTTA